MSKSPSALDCAGRQLDLAMPVVMGILNVTPDSFSDGGCYDSLGAAIDRTAVMAASGAAIIDVGGESTRPGSDSVAVQQELDRVVPVIEALSQRFTAVISVDTSKPEVMTAAVAAGAGMINDVYALRRDGALQAAAQAAVPVCLMHMLGQPRDMQHQPRYDGDDVVAAVNAFLQQRLAACKKAGILPRQLILDPGFGFGKTLQHNLSLLRNLGEFSALGYPVLAGISRKSMLQQITGLPVDQRLHASVAAAVIAALNGASILRVHDVAATVQALQVVEAIRIES